MIRYGGQMGFGASLSECDWRPHSAPEITTPYHHLMAQTHNVTIKYHPFTSAIFNIHVLLS